jgi:hypothetical protein
MVVRLKHLEPSDLDSFETRDLYNKFYEDMLYSIEASNREVILVTYDKISLMILGVNYFHPGVGELWLVPSKHVLRFPLQTVKITKTLIEGCLFAERKMRRLFFYVNNSWEKGHKWANVLGFNLEGIAKAYGENNEDFALYAKVRVS